MVSISLKPGRSTRPLVALALTLWAVLTIAGVVRNQAAPESRVMEAVCGLLLGNSDEGRQALVSSIWWPPLPVIVRLPFAFLATGTTLPVACVAVSALFGVLTLVFLTRSLARQSAGTAGAILSAILLLQPAFLTACMDGSNTTTLTALSILAAGGLAGWFHARTTSELLRFAFGASLLLVTSPECWPWLGLAFAILLVDLFVRPADTGQREAVLLLALSPVLYMAGLWLLLNWLVMGDGLYCVRSLMTEGPEEVGIRLKIQPFLPALGVLAVALCIALVRRQVAGIMLAVLAASPLAIAAGLQMSRLPWNEQALLLMITPLVFLTIGRAAAGSEGPRRWLQPLAIVAGLAVVLPPWLGRAAAGTHATAASPEAIMHVQGIRHHVLQRSPHAKVFVCGYESFHLLTRDAGPVFTPSLDFNFNHVKNAYRGHTLFVLVRKPDGRSAMDSIHWQYEDMYALGSRSTLYDGDWGDWRLFEIIEAPRRRVL